MTVWNFDKSITSQSQWLILLVAWILINKETNVARNASSTTFEFDKLTKMARWECDAGKAQVSITS